ncbi:MAG: MoaD/ThiS family protein [Actinomycetota bacterium]|jgi:molybdopterin converting factor small subunit|nr:MoaD/ThiS family protein [Actinomycetota bacterium]
MATLLLFGPARTAAREGRVTLDAPSLSELCDAACRRYGPEFERVLRASTLWVNGEPVSGEAVIGRDDEVAVVPPVSGGA